jgi:hypothetical protein
MITGDKAELEKLSLPELSYGHSSGRIENKGEFIEALVSGKSGFSSIELSEQTVNIVDRIALVRHVFNGKRKADGSNMKLSILTVWLDRQDQWKLLARQAAKL